jgi:hypothetical protein
VVGAKLLPSLRVLMDTVLKTLWDLGFKPAPVRHLSANASR